MLSLRKSEERGHANHGWLDTYHSFSFGHYMDPEHMGFRTLRVLNDDTVQAGEGFGTHGHRDMEIVSYVLNGALEHQDSMGTGSVLRAGDVQRMSAGTGVTHSEFNHSKFDGLRFLQIWFLPAAQGIEPGYEEISVSDDEKRGQLRLIVAPGGGDGVLNIHQDVRVFASLLSEGDRVEHELAQGRGAWIQVATGSVLVHGQRLGRGDGAAIEDEPNIIIEATSDAEMLLFDLA